LQSHSSKEQVPSDNVGAGVLAPCNRHKMRNASLTLIYISLILTTAIAQTNQPEVLSISPTSGPEGTRVAITGKNLQEVSAVCFGTTNSAFSLVSPEELIALIPHKNVTSRFTVVTPRGRASSPFPFVITNDPRVPDEVSYKAGYVNPVPPPRDFKSALLWGIAIADTRVPGYESAAVEIASTQLSCRVDGKDVILNDDTGNVRGGLYRRSPWFGSDQHDPMPVTHDLLNHVVVLSIGLRPDRIWHFWSPSPRATLPSGNLESCTVKARVKISPGALLQMGMDYWRTPTVAYGPGGNNHEAGASNWYFPSTQWQEATFTDLGGPQF
jgi:IPT/TIG domain